MNVRDLANASSGSTTYGWKPVKMRRRPQGPSSTTPEAATLPSLSRRAPRDPLSIQIRYRGGAEAWWELRARGRVWRVPGHLAIHDAMQRIMDGEGGKSL